MKGITLPLVALALVSFEAIKSGLTDTERKMAQEKLTTTQEHLINTVKGLSEAQLNFKPTPGSWSIAECVEHLTIAENSFGEMLKGALQTPADPSKHDSLSMTDEDIMSFTVDRGKKVKTAEPFEPSGKFGSFEETLKTFNSKREEHIEYLKHTKDDLRNHYGQLPFGTIDGFQIFLFMGGHTERHVLQMEEVMAHADFPKMGGVQPE